MKATWVRWLGGGGAIRKEAVDGEGVRFNPEAFVQRLIYSHYAFSFLNAAKCYTQLCTYCGSYPTTVDTVVHLYLLPFKNSCSQSQRDCLSPSDD